jgi:hypothetical protein
MGNTPGAKWHSAGSRVDGGEDSGGTRSGRGASRHDRDTTDGGSETHARSGAAKHDYYTPDRGGGAHDGWVTVGHNCDIARGDGAAHAVSRAMTPSEAGRMEEDIAEASPDVVVAV